jgi:hypothetical protein
MMAKISQEEIQLQQEQQHTASLLKVLIPSCVSDQVAKMQRDCKLDVIASNIELGVVMFAR